MSVLSELIIINPQKLYPVFSHIGKKYNSFKKGKTSDSINEFQFKPIHDFDEYYKLGTGLLELLRQTEAVTFDEENRYSLSKFLLNNPKGNLGDKLLGYAAEAVIVRNCNRDLNENKKWANYARKRGSVIVGNTIQFSLFDQFENIFGFQPFIENTDDYKAIGIGFTSTKESKYRSLYNTNSQRDICWIHKNYNGRELLNIDKSYNHKIAGLQVKVSCQNNGRYVTRYLRNRKYTDLFPVVYFDLGNDFDLVKSKLIKLDDKEVMKDTLLDPNIYYGNYSRDEILDMMLIRGKNISPDLHDELLFYKEIFDSVPLRENKIDNYLTDKNILNSLILNYVNSQYKIKQVLTVPVST
ncbi:MAG: hypothetical protein AB4372_15990 [Xenococcus sp. (in: cyanobacteria)]